MLNEKEYLGFSMRIPGEGVVINLFDIVRDGLRRYGPYKFEGNVEKTTTMVDASVVIVRFEDGTLPIPIEEFDERSRAGETWGNNHFNIFTKVRSIGPTSIYDNIARRKAVLFNVLKEEGDDFYLMMFDNCVERLNQSEKADRRRNKLTKAHKMYSQHLDQMEELFSDKEAYADHRNLIIDLLDEAYNVADAKLVEFILKQNSKLARSGVPANKRPARIARATVKKCNDEFVNGPAPRNKKKRKSVKRA